MQDEESFADPIDQVRSEAFEIRSAALEARLHAQNIRAETHRIIEEIRERIRPTDMRHRRQGVNE